MDDWSELYKQHLSVLEVTWHNALVQASADAVLIYSGDEQSIYLDDSHYPFKANPHFKHWLPLTQHSQCWILIKPGQTPQLFYYQAQDYWHQPAAQPEGFWTDCWDISCFSQADIMAKQLKDIIQQSSKTIYVGEAEQHGVIDACHSNNCAVLLNRVNYQRAYKTPYEQRCLEQANATAALGHKVVAENFALQASEFDLHKLYLSASKQREQQLPYSNIVAINENAAVLHYQHVQVQPPSEHLSLLIDAGATCNGYASDITRSYSTNKSDVFAQLILAMQHLQNQLVSNIKPGISYLDIQLLMHELTAKILVDFELATCSTQQLVEQQLTHYFIPHGVGHLLGLQVHDVGGFMRNSSGDLKPAPTQHPYLRLTRTIEQNMVFTIEPGLYFIPLLLKQLKLSSQQNLFNWTNINNLRAYGGIRIEDNILVSAQGSQNLTRPHLP